MSSSGMGVKKNVRINNGTAAKTDSGPRNRTLAGVV